MGRNNLKPKSGRQVPPSKQLSLEFEPRVQEQVFGIEMGILRSGRPNLTQKGLAALAGASPRAIRRIDKEWSGGYGGPIQEKTKLGFLQRQLFKEGFDFRRLYIRVKKGMSTHCAYTDGVYMVFLEYFAFEAPNRRARAEKVFRSLARHGLQEFMYESLKYVAEGPWEHYMERVKANDGAVPIGYFIVFNEIADHVAKLLSAGLPVDQKTVPDISIGQTWSRHWEGGNLELDYKKGRIPCEHSHPEWFPQTKSYPQNVWAYPEDPLPEFRHWYRHTYMAELFPAYIMRKATELEGGTDEAKQLVTAVKQIYLQKRLGSKTYGIRPAA